MINRIYHLDRGYEMPQSVVEYQGGYHQSEHQTKLDKFKEMILGKVGLALRQITHQELAEF